MTHLESLTRAGRRLTRDLTDIDAAVRVIASRPDWLSAAAEELAVTQRSLEFTLAKIHEARSRYAEMIAGGAAVETPSRWRDWPTEDEGKFQEVLAVVETTMGER